MSGFISLHPAPCLVRCDIYENTIALAMCLKQCAQRTLARMIFVTTREWESGTYFMNERRIKLFSQISLHTAQWLKVGCSHQTRPQEPQPIGLHFYFDFHIFPCLVCCCWKSSLDCLHLHGWQRSFPPSFFCLLFKCNKLLLKILYTTVVILIARENHICNTNSSNLLHSTYLGVCGTQPLCEYLSVVYCMAQGSAHISTPSSKYTPILAY